MITFETETEFEEFMEFTKKVIKSSLTIEINKDSMVNGGGDAQRVEVDLYLDEEHISGWSYYE